MKKRGRKKLGIEGPLVCCLLVEGERDLKESARRRSVLEASERMAERFRKLGARINAETIRRQYKAAKRLLGTPTGQKALDRALLELRERRNTFGWSIETAALIGIDSSDLTELWSGRLAFMPALELAALRSNLRIARAESQDIDQELRRLNAERDGILAEMAQLGGGKLN